MSTLTQAPVLVPPPGRVLPPRARVLRPAPAAAPPLKDPHALAAWRDNINRTALARSGEALSVVLYALTGPGEDPHTDLAAAQHYAERHRLLVVDRIVDTLARDDQASTDQPELRRGYARTLHLLGDPASPVRGLVTTSQTAVTRVGRLYEAQLDRYAALRAALFLVRAETEISAMPSTTLLPLPQALGGAL
ncbi:hypothetical protein OG393_33225 (plasmid) [Streptomyces sp. NBC_01216]|uniref:hypothetical protein n=1 Tax=Streptomyces sp. NBC_01216 TaxID=2903778 RepID=UPI002E10DE02|nr:hypothetical protein OG393_33225 [Streptomyces sp. NBC_01216]